MQVEAGVDVYFSASLGSRRLKIAIATNSHAVLLAVQSELYNCPKNDMMHLSHVLHILCYSTVLAGM